MPFEVSFWNLDRATYELPKVHGDEADLEKRGQKMSCAIAWKLQVANKISNCIGKPSLRQQLLGDALCCWARQGSSDSLYVFSVPVHRVTPRGARLLLLLLLQ